MRLLHYTAEPLVFVRGSRDYGQGLACKPVGFWVSVQGEDDWESWCRSEEFRLNRLACVSEVSLTDTANLLILGDEDAVGTLSKRYPNPLRPSDRYYIDWTRIASEYDGIIIAPYQWYCRMTVDWYYTWDCASGCIWNLDAIASVSAVERVSS